MRNPITCAIVALLAGLMGCTRDLDVERVSDSAAQGGNRHVTLPESGGSHLSNAGQTTTSPGSAAFGGSSGQGGTSNSGGASGSGGSAAPAGAANVGGVSSPGGASSFSATAGISGDASGGADSGQQFLCGLRETTELFAPLPEDPGTFRSMSYELCLNGSCASLLPGTEASSSIVVSGGVGLHVVEPTRNIKLTMTFWFLEIPCSTGCITPSYQMRATAAADPNSSLADGDIWRLTILTGDGTVFYQHSTIATYVTKRIDGSGDYMSLWANCRTLSVPMSSGADPTAGCRAPGEPGCSECCEQSPSTSGESTCVRYSSQAGWSDWYNVSRLDGATCASTCARCAQCTLREEQELRALVRPTGCDCSTTDIGIDPCIAPDSCECYCERYLSGIRNCPQLVP